MGANKIAAAGAQAIRGAETGARARQRNRADAFEQVDTTDAVGMRTVDVLSRADVHEASVG